MRSQGGNGEYRVFEMTKRSSSDDGQSTSLHSQSDGESITTKIKSRYGSVDRRSMILSAISLIVSIVFLVTALMYSFQVKSELKAVSGRLKNDNHVNSNDSDDFAKTVANLKRVELRLKAEIISLKQADTTQADAWVAAVEQLKLENQKRFSDMTVQLQELYQANTNQTRQLITLEEWKRNDSRRLDRLPSQLEAFKQANSNNSKALLLETVERIRQDSKLMKQLQDLTNSWNSGRSSILAQLAQWRNRSDVYESQNQSMKADVAKLTRITNLLANHWGGDPKTLLYRRFDQKVTYQTAVSRCKSMGGNIAAKVLRDVDLVRDMITYGYLTKDESVWIGYYANAGERIWRWTDGGTTNARTTRWNTGEPNDFGQIEDCAEANVATSESIGMNDLSCSSNRGYLCEMIMN